jgi:GT2 family glycosyltransferase
MLEVTLVIVNFNTIDYLHECLASIYQYMPSTTEVIVVDNASIDGSCEMVKKEFPQVKLIESEVNLGFGAGNNLGVANASHDYVMLFNSDAVLKMNTAEGLLAYMTTHPEVSCVTPRVVLPKTFDIQPKTFGFKPNLRTVFMQSLGLNRLFPKCEHFNGIDGDYRWAREMEVGWVSGVCMLIRRADYQAVEGFDKRFFMYCEDIELCLKLSKLGKIILLDDFDIIHYGGASSRTIAAKVRNGVWQQRHLLMIIRDYSGLLQSSLASCILAFGLIMRIMAAVLKIPKNGIEKNELLQASWARLGDLIGFNVFRSAKRKGLAK